MKLSVNIKPTVQTAPTKSGLISKIASGKILTYSSILGNGFISTSIGHETITVYNIHKVRTKHKQTKNSKGKTIKSVLVKQGHWIAYVYKFKSDLLKSLDLKVEQKTRNFKIVPKK